MLARIPIRWRLAGGSALLTLTILLAFAAVVGSLTATRISDDFKSEVSRAADDLQQSIKLGVDVVNNRLVYRGPDLNAFATTDSSEIRILKLNGELIAQTRGAQNFGLPTAPSTEKNDFRVESRTINVIPEGQAIVQYARPTTNVGTAVARVWVFLGIGVLGGTFLALLAGLAVARQAMTPIVGLTSAARVIANTRDPSLRLPMPEARDEVTELATTLDEMLTSLDAARSETEAALSRQQQFIADASHELRTPLTSVLANLDLLCDQLAPESGETAEAALRSAQRMRRIVSDLLLLARADSNRELQQESVALDSLLLEVITEVTPIAGNHHLEVDASPVTVLGVRDDLYRLMLNLLENAVKYTPDGTSITASLHAEDQLAELTIADQGPGIPAELQEHVFERFYRTGSDSGGGSGLGLAIVKAVAEQHGGTIKLGTNPSGVGLVATLRIPLRND